MVPVLRPGPSFTIVSHIVYKPVLAPLSVSRTMCPACRSPRMSCVRLSFSSFLQVLFPWAPPSSLLSAIDSRSCPVLPSYLRFPSPYEPLWTPVLFCLAFMLCSTLIHHDSCHHDHSPELPDDDLFLAHVLPILGCVSPSRLICVSNCRLPLDLSNPDL